MFGSQAEKEKSKKMIFLLGGAKASAIAPLKIDTAGNFFCKDLKKGKKRKTNMKKKYKKTKNRLEQRNYGTSNQAVGLIDIILPMLVETL